MPATAYAAAGAVLAALITSSISFVNLVISKDQKTSDFRQSWIDALRDDLSKMIGHIFNISAVVDYYIWKYKDDKDKAMEEVVKVAGPNIALVSELYHRIILRLNPKDDKDLVEAVTALYDMLSVIETNMIKQEEIDKTSARITELSHKLLKKEWKRVKRGEWAFAITKYGSLLLAIFFLVTCYINKDSILKIISSEVSADQAQKDIRQSTKDMPPPAGRPKKQVP